MVFGGIHIDQGKNKSWYDDYIKQRKKNDENSKKFG
jgi:hypothetical protein